MGLSLNAADARKAENVSSVIKDSGKYVGVITRAEKLLSQNKTEGVGLSFKSDDGASANYLDVYTIKADGTKLHGYNVVQALLACLKLRSVDEGPVNFERWDSQQRKMVPTSATGYPVMMGKRIGLVLQKVMETNNNTGADAEKMAIVVPFEAATGMVASEILDGKTTAEKVDTITKIVTSKPFRDNRKGGSRPAPAAHVGGEAAFEDDIPFAAAYLNIQQ